MNPRAVRGLPLGLRAIRTTIPQAECTGRPVPSGLAAGAAGQLPDVRMGLLNGVRSAGQPDAMPEHLQMA